VLTGSGTAAAYHAGVVKALDESGVKVDVVVGSGAGTIAAAFGAIAGSARLYGETGFWAGVRWRSFYRLRLAARTALLLVASSYGLFLLPLVLAIVGFVLFLPALIADWFLPGTFARLIGQLAAAPAVVRGPYLGALTVPVFALCVLATVAALRLFVRDRRRFTESLESLLDAERGRDRLSRALWEIARGPALSDAPPAEAELGRRYVALAAENLGQPGFRELILRVADLETGGALAFVLLQDAHRNSFAASRSRGPRSRVEGMPDAIDLRAPGGDGLFFDAVMTGLLPPLVAPVRRVAFPKGGLYGGETHRLTDATLVSGCGLGEALAAGAEQVIVVSPTSEEPAPPTRRRGPRAQADGALALLERQAVDRDVAQAERINRMIQTLGHDTATGRAWQDPATGRLYRDFALYIVRPERRGLGPLEWDGARDPATEVLETPEDLIERGYKDAYRLFVEPIVGAAPEPRRATLAPLPEHQPVGL